jgi:putative polyhydroxyalkanoate system protein
MKDSIMSNIDISAHHNLSHEDAISAADELCAELAAKFGIDYGWDEDTVYFDRPGVSGSIVVQENEIGIQANLGFMLMMLKDPIEKEIVSHLKSHFGCDPDNF